MSKISWQKALVDYLKDETQSYNSIAADYGVSLQAVKKRAGKEGWQDLRRRSIQKVNQELPELIAESVADINSRQARLGKLLQSISVKVIQERDYNTEDYQPDDSKRLIILAKKHDTRH